MTPTSLRKVTVIKALLDTAKDLLASHRLHHLHFVKMSEQGNPFPQRFNAQAPTPARPETRTFTLRIEIRTAQHITYTHLTHTCPGFMHDIRHSRIAFCFLSPVLPPVSHPGNTTRHGTRAGAKHREGQFERWRIIRLRPGDFCHLSSNGPGSVRDARTTRVKRDLINSETGSVTMHMSSRDRN